MKTLVIAPHADDELLGCGGTLLKRYDEGHEISWLLMTSIKEKDGWPINTIKKRRNEINSVREMLKIKTENFYELCLPTTKLDEIPLNIIIKKISNIFSEFEPNEVFIPYPGDIHSDHRITFEASQACTKWFRYPFIKKIYAYETLSETDYQLDPRFQKFSPNTFIDISKNFEKKIKLLKIYESEIRNHPFPRSVDSVKALAYLRGSQMGVKAAEAFSLLKHIEL